MDVNNKTQTKKSRSLKKKILRINCKAISDNDLDY